MMHPLTGVPILFAALYGLYQFVGVLGEIPNREAALRQCYAALKPGGLLSITEIFPDPHYQSRNTVRRLAEAAAFRFDHSEGNWLSFTMNFMRPTTE
jgi:ubiquinone/menaquinone biosynthesis C-methylase UbiE